MTRDPAAEKRIKELEAELERVQRRLATKEREVGEIYRSRAWRLVSTLRTLKQRLGINWPRRRAATATATATANDEIAPAREDKYDVVCLAIHDWDFRFQRPQQLMTRFGAAGHRVFFVSPHFGTAPWTATRKAGNVYEITLRGDADSLARLQHDASVSDAVIVVQQPSWWLLARETHQRFGWPVIYDCMDLHAGFTTTRATHEDALLEHADLVVVSSAFLEQHAKRKRHDVLVLRNACDYEHFAATPRANNARPVIGYYGAIAEWFDSGLVATLAERRPDWDFLLIGSLYGANMSRLAELPNVSLQGEQPYESLPDWLGRFDVAIIPFRRTRLTEATNPVKVYEMLASGKPVVSVPIPEVAALAPLVRMASTADDFEREISAALKDDNPDERRAFAREQTWQKRFDVLAAAISETRAGQR